MAKIANKFTRTLWEFARTTAWAFPSRSLVVPWVRSSVAGMVNPYGLSGLSGSSSSPPTASSTPPPTAPFTPSAPSSPSAPSAPFTPWGQAGTETGAGTTNPMDTFTKLAFDMLQKSQGMTADQLADLEKRQRALQRASIGRTEEVTPEELRTMSPAQQEAIRSGNVKALTPDIDENAYQLRKAQLNKENFEKLYVEAKKIGEDFAEKMVAPQSTIDSLARLIESGESMSDVLGKVNDKTRTAVMAAVDPAKMKAARTLGTSEGGGIGGGITGNPVVDSWVSLIQSKSATIANVPAGLKNAVAQALGASSQTQGGISETSSDVIELIDRLLAVGEGPLARITGPLDQWLGGKFGKAATAKNIYDQIKGMLSLENRQKLKGSGAISDYESKVLAQAASSLGRNLSNKEFLRVINQLKADLAAGGISKNITAGGGGVDDELLGNYGL